MYSTSSDTDGTEPCTAAGLYGAGHGAGQQRGVRRGFEQVHHARPEAPPGRALLLVVEVEIGDLAQLVHPVFGVDEADRAAA